MMHETILSKQEKKWILDRCVARLSDKKEVQIYPMGAERYIAAALSGHKKERYNLRADIVGKDVLVIPGHGNTSFLFAEAGARTVSVYDKDPVTIAWIKTFKKYYHYKEAAYPSIGELLAALTRWYPPLERIPLGKYTNPLLWGLNPNWLRRAYIHYMVSLAQKAVKLDSSDFELAKPMQFYAKTLESIESTQDLSFDTAFVPYLLGVKAGIEKEKDIVQFIGRLSNYVPKGNILVTPTRDVKEFYVLGKRYFITTGYANIQDLPGLQPYWKAKDDHWFHTQGLAVFGRAAEG